MWVFISNLPKVTKGAVSLFFVIFLLYPYFLVFSYMNFCSYKDEVTIGTPVCHGFTWSDDNAYVNGLDCLNFSIDVTFDNKRALGFHADTLVYDKDGDFVGQLCCVDFDSDKLYEDGLCFEPNTTQTFWFYAYHVTGKSWENDPVLKELYYGNLEDYTFVTKITYVIFANFKIVGNDNVHWYDTEGNIHWEEF